MTASDAMAALDAVVAKQARMNQYPAAKALYEASVAGLVRGEIPPTTLYGWVLKWATLPDARGVRESGS